MDCRVVKILQASHYSTLYSALTYTHSHRSSPPAAHLQPTCMSSQPVSPCAHLWVTFSLLESWFSLPQQRSSPTKSQDYKRKKSEHSTFNSEHNQTLLLCTVWPIQSGTQKLQARSSLALCIQLYIIVRMFYVLK